MDINCPLPNGPPDDAKRNHFGQQSLKKQQKLPKTELNAKQHCKGFSWLMFVTAPRSIPNGIDEASRFIGSSLGFPKSYVVSTSIETAGIALKPQDQEMVPGDRCSIETSKHGRSTAASRYCFCLFSAPMALRFFGKSMAQFRQRTRITRT